MDEKTNVSETPTTSLNQLDLEAKIREGLRKVYDPELGMSVVELGLIRKIEFVPEQVNVTMILTTPFCPYGPALIEQVKQTAQEVSMMTAKVEMGLEMWEPTMMEDQAAANWGLYY
jgi:metal-sulfur cluster biosynthetic enzyme